MKNLGICLLALVVLALALPVLRMGQAGAQGTLPEVSREPELDTKARTFFDTLSKGNTPSAFEELLRQSPLGTSGTAQIAELQKKVDELKSQFGEMRNYEKIGTKRIGEDVIVQTWLLKYEQYPVQWTFLFYRKPTSAGAANPNAWTLIECQFGTVTLQPAG